ncbi:DNA replication fork-blocking protein Fob1p [Monosporozyma unispora]|nr:hypothetical protein C6P44_002660 [Kazachstania unispora]
MTGETRNIKILDVPGRLVSHPEKFNSRRAVFKTQVIPLVGERYTKYVDDSLDKELLERGEREVIEYCQTINGKMTHELYQYLVNDNVNKETVRKMMTPHTSNGEVSRKLMLITHRYFKDENGMIRDHIKDNKVVFDPIFTFDMIMGCHLLNDHSIAKDVQQGLWEFYSNASLKVVSNTLQFCSVCNPDKNIRRVVKERTFYTYRHLMPVERVHFEIFEPYPGELIEGKYSHVLMCRDYYSKYRWMLPLKSTKFKRIVPKIAELLFMLPRIPIFIESATLNWQDMFDIFESIAGKYSLQIGLGTSEKHRQFHLYGTYNLKRKFLQNKEAGINDWNTLLFRCCHRSNLIFDSQVGGPPSDLMNSNIPHVKNKFRTKRSEYIHQTIGPRIVNISKGQIYLEMLDENGNGDTGALNTVDETTDEVAKAIEDEMENFSDSDDEVMIAKYKEVETKKKNEASKRKLNAKIIEHSANTTSANKDSFSPSDSQDLNGDTITAITQNDDASFAQGTQNLSKRRRARDKEFAHTPDNKKLHLFLDGSGKANNSSDNE